MGLLEEIEESEQEAEESDDDLNQSEDDITIMAITYLSEDFLELVMPPQRYPLNAVAEPESRNRKVNWNETKSARISTFRRYLSQSV